MATIYKRLKNYVNSPGVFRATYTGVSTMFHPFINSEKYRSLLFKDLYDYSKKNPVKIADWYWMNDNIPWQSAELEAGDYVQFQAEGDKHRIGSEGHIFNTIRYINTIYRLKRPFNILKLGKTEGTVNPLQLPLINLDTGISYNSFNQYCANLNYKLLDLEREKRIVMLIESINYKDLWINLSKSKYKHINISKERPHYPGNLVGKKLKPGQIYTYKTYSNVKPNIMFQYVYDTATKEERDVLVRTYIQTPPRPIKE